MVEGREDHQSHAPPLPTPGPQPEVQGLGTRRPRSRHRQGPLLSPRACLVPSPIKTTTLTLPWAAKGEGVRLGAQRLTPTRLRRPGLGGDADSESQCSLCAVCLESSHEARGCSGRSGPPLPGGQLRHRGAQPRAPGQAVRKRHGQDSNPALPDVKACMCWSVHRYYTSASYVPGAGSEPGSWEQTNTETLGRVLSPSVPRFPQL